MGDRASISFRKGKDESVTLFSHWGGKAFQDNAEKYIYQLKQLQKGKMVYPLERLEPATVMVDFIRSLTTGMDRVKSDLYLGRDSTDGDNSNNGHRIIDL